MRHAFKDLAGGFRVRFLGSDTWILLAAAVAVPLLGGLQYRWLSDLGAAQRAELHQNWEDAVARSAAAINTDVSAFYAAMLDMPRGEPDVQRIADAVMAWRRGATTLGAFAHAYVHDSGAGKWVAVHDGP